MPSAANQTSRLSWLSTSLANKRDKILGLLSRLTGLSSSDRDNPSIFRKFADMLEEVATAQEEEKSLIARIDAVEQRHLSLRKGRKLKLARPLASSAHLAAEEQPEPPRRGILWLVVVWYMFFRERMGQKGQDFTID